MFKSITENPYKPTGKFTGENTLKGKSNQFSLGRPEWED